MLPEFPPERAPIVWLELTSTSDAPEATVKSVPAGNESLPTGNEALPAGRDSAFAGNATTPDAPTAPAAPSSS